MAQRGNVRTAIALSFLAAIFIFGCWVRIVNLQESLWLDELHTSWTVSGNLNQVAARAADGNQAPWFYGGEWLAARFLGQHEYSLRLISLLAGSVLIPAVSWLVWRGTKSAIASIAATLLVAIDPDLIFYSVEARPYGLVSLMGLFQMAVFANLILGPVNRQVSAAAEFVNAEIHSPAQLVRWHERLYFAGLTVALFYLHYTAILILMPELILWAIAQLFASVRIRYSIAKLPVDLLIVAACCSPAVLPLLDIAARRDDWSTIVQTWPIDPRFLRMLAAYAIPVSAISLLWIFARGCVTDKSKWKFATLARIAVLTLGFLIVLAAVWLATKYQIAALLLPRYIAVLIAVPIAAAGLSLGLFGKRWLQATLAVGIVAAAFSANYWFSPWFRECVRSGAVLPMHAEEDWRAAVEEINSQPRSGRQTIFLMSELVEDHRLAATPETGPPDERFVEYCKFPLQGIYRVSPERYEIVPLPSAPITRRFTDEQLQQIEAQGGAWIVSRGPRAANNARAELECLFSQRHVKTLAQGKPFGSVILVRLRIE